MVVILLLLLSEAATGGVLWKKAFLHISRISWESASVGVSLQLSCRPDNLRLSRRDSEVFVSAFLKNVGQRLLLYCCDFVLLFFMLRYNVPLIVNHFTCYLSISRDQLSSVFSWSLTYLARALVMFLFFFFPCIIQNFAWSLYYVPRAQVKVASPNWPKMLLLLSSAPHATIWGEQVITQMKCKWNKFCFSDRLCM